MRGARRQLLEAAPLRSTTLRDRAFHALRQAILSGQLAPGARLLENELAARLGVSRNPVREALAQLESHGLIRSVPNQGAHVVQPSPAQVQDALLVRAQLELLALRLALHKAGLRTFEPMSALVRQMHEVANDPAVGADTYGQMNLLDLAFHEQLVACAESESLQRTWIAAAPLDLIFAYDIAVLLNQESEGSALMADAEKHERLLAALLSGDAQQAEPALKEHFTAPPRSGMVSLDEASLKILGW